MIYVVTLTFNLVSEVQKACERLYEQNEGTKFTHLICDLSFPLLTGNEIPEDLEEAKKSNSEALRFLAARFGAKYVKMPNIGVSQNWSQVIEYLKPTNEDYLVSCEPDEVQNENGWVQAMVNALKGGLAYCAPMLVEHKELLANNPNSTLTTIGGEEVYVIQGNINYGQISFSGEFLNLIGGIPAPSTMPIYGGIESVLHAMVNRFDRQWGLLKNYTTTHTDYEKGTPNTSKLLREWKNWCVFKSGGKQIQFDEWLIKKQEVEKVIAR